MIVTPEYLFRSVSHITPEFLRSQGVRGLVLDVDNTLTGDESQTLDDEVRDWLAAMRAEGIALTIASNNDAALPTGWACSLSQWPASRCLSV